MDTFFDTAAELIKVVVPTVATLATLVVSSSAFRMGVLRRKQSASHGEAESTKEERQAAVIVRAALGTSKDLPFETEQLSKFYAQVLAQSKNSFWFSLTFASIGFLVIVFAVFTYDSNSIGTATMKLVAGLVIDAVAGLFFVQSKDAQKAMGEFFEKLRKDRQQLESRALCESISDTKAQDALRVQLSLYYAGISDYQVLSKDIVDRCLSRKE